MGHPVSEFHSISNTVCTLCCLYVHTCPNLVQTGSLIGTPPPPDFVRSATSSPFDSLVGALDGPTGGMHMMPDPIGPSGPGGPPTQYGGMMGGGGGGGGGYYPYSGQSDEI